MIEFKEKEIDIESRQFAHTLVSLRFVIRKQALN